MKEASGELSFTLIVIIAAGVVLAIFMAFREPITNMISKTWESWFEQADDAQDGMIVRDFN